MPWNKQNYPDSMKNLDTKVRNKAVEIANALLEDGYEEGRAIAISISQAKKWADNEPHAKKPDIHVLPHPDGWAVRRTGAERASFVFESKAEAKRKAKDMAQDEGVGVLVHQDNGELEAKS